MTKPYGYDDVVDDDDDHKDDSSTADGAAPGASVPCSLFLL